MPKYTPYARYYDLAHATKKDVPFYLDYAAQCGGPLLELACGTGRLILPLAEAGCQITGLDLCEDMLAVCRAKVAEHGLSDRVTLTQGDMSSFELPSKDFALAYVPLRSFSHLFTQRDQIGCLRCTANHLRAGGTLIVTTFAPYYQVLAQEHEGEDIKRREFTMPDGNSVVQWERFIRNDVARQILHFCFRFEERDRFGDLVNTVEVPMDMRYTFRYELQLLFEKAGFEVTDVFRDYERGPYDGTGEIIMVGRKLI
jgi:SAM-dependent methyltransferase